MTEAENLIILLGRISIAIGVVSVVFVLLFFPVMLYEAHRHRKVRDDENTPD